MGLPREEMQKRLYDSMDASKRLMAPYFTAMLSKHHVSAAQSHLLATINDDQPVSLKKLATKLQMTPGAITQLVEPLEQQALIVRSPDPHDRRIANLTISPKGTKVINAIHGFRNDLMSRSVTALTDAELAQLVAIHEKMAANLKKFIEAQKRRNHDRKTKK